LRIRNVSAAKCENVNLHAHVINKCQILMH